MPKLDLSYKSLASIALPLSLGAFAQFLVVLTDNALLSDVGIAAINGAGNGGMLYLTAVMIGIGLSSGVQIFISRKNGEGNVEEIGKWFGTGLKVALTLAVLLYLLFLYVDSMVIDTWYTDQALLEEMHGFMQIRFIGLFVYFPLLILNSFYIGIAKTKILSVAMALTALANIALDYILIYGEFGFPQMNAEGAALASLISETIGLVFMLVYSVNNRFAKQAKLKDGLFTRNQGLTRRLLKISAPLMLQQTLAMGMWTVFYVLVGKVGMEELKVSHIVRNVYMLAFICIMGVGYTTRTVISTLIAEERQSEINLAIKRLMTLNFCGVLLLCHGLILYPEFIASLFYEPNAVGIAMLKDTFLVVFPAVMFFSLSGILHNSVEGSGKTRIGLAIELVAIVIYILFVYQVTIINSQPIHIIWTAEFVYFILIGGLALLYLWLSNWKYTKI